MANTSQKDKTTEAPKAGRFIPDECQRCARCDDCSKQRLFLEINGNVQIRECGIYLAKSNVGKGDNPSPPDVHTIQQPTQKPSDKAKEAAS